MRRLNKLYCVQNMFWDYFTFGWEHIMSWGAWDHLLFVAALISIYTARDFRKIIILVTAFTIGHSITLALASLGHISIRSALVEFLIPLTILLTALYNVVNKQDKYQRMFPNYLLALGFGLIHGLGFAGSLMSLLGKTSSLVIPLLGFNIGLEIGQILVVIMLLLISWFLEKYLKARHHELSIFINGGAFFASFIMLTERWPF